MRYVVLFTYIFTCFVASGLHLLLWCNLIYWPGIGSWAVLKEYGVALLYGLFWPLNLLISLFDK